MSVIAPPRDILVASTTLGVAEALKLGYDLRVAATTMAGLQDAHDNGLGDHAIWLAAARVLGAANRAFDGAVDAVEQVSPALAVEIECTIWGEQAAWPVGPASQSIAS